MGLKLDSAGALNSACARIVLAALVAREPPPRNPDHNWVPGLRGKTPHGDDTTRVFGSGGKSPCAIGDVVGSCSATAPEGEEPLREEREDSGRLKLLAPAACAGSRRKGGLGSASGGSLGAPAPAGMAGGSGRRRPVPRLSLCTGAALGGAAPAGSPVEPTGSNGNVDRDGGRAAGAGCFAS